MADVGSRCRLPRPEFPAPDLVFPLVAAPALPNSPKASYWTLLFGGLMRKKIQRGTALWSRAKLVRVARASARKARRSGRIHKFSLSERMNGTHKDTFVRVLLMPFPQARSRWFALGTIADIYGVHLRTVWRWVSYGWISMTVPRGQTRKLVSKNQVRALHRKFRKEFLKQSPVG
jgi:hypothetical protein